MQIIFGIFVSPCVKRCFDECILLLLYMRMQKDLLKRKQFYGTIKATGVLKGYSSYEKRPDNTRLPRMETKIQ